MSPIKTAINSDKAPPPREGVLNSAIVSGGFVFCSGQLARSPETGKMVEGDIQARTHQVIRNLAALLEAAGSHIDNVVKVNVFLADMKDFDQMNEVYKQYWGSVKPSRTCVAVKTLPGGTDVEIECVAAVGAGARAKL
ncbi:putative L-PSP endoribonuclease family protein [Cryphonectria parasitica EP155]|uniref:L-PSP endoribonuclease family protein n=1 Tax=Cryphonectria parasitica (strain ATCC 38755 / EP155) TaxID=660469 RepID=A0A9P4XXD1_CRYP1|nr:putative L-PSP endoribonuclease family protein [Cryphonectria parasitica EP155]KAF3762653.1 putative L-PSP endoribonuclease family protein [Cryphonectria parasitica EP155]